MTEHPPHEDFDPARQAYFDKIDAEVRTAAANGTLRHAAFSEDTCALAFVDLYETTLRYIGSSKQWYLYDGISWVQDDQSRAFAFARSVVRNAASKKRPKDRAKAGSSSFCSGVERLARTDQRIQATIETFDSNPWLLGTPGGTIDLRVGVLGPPMPEHYISKLTSIAPGGDCPRFREFIREVTGGDAALGEYLQRLFGYCLTADTSEEMFAFFHGLGSNGKSTLINCISNILGDYAKNAGVETFTQRRHEQEIARFAGARVVTAAETEEGRKFDEALIKRMTGRDKITANFMRMNSFEFSPTFKILISGNEEPELKVVNDAMRRRIHLVPFNFKPEQPDPQLELKLQDEAAGILQWCIEGCLEWQSIGLQPPDAVMKATADYLENQDVFGDFFEQCCNPVKGGEVTSSRLFECWAKYAERAGEKPRSMKFLASRMKSRGFPVEQFRFSDGTRNRGFRDLYIKPGAM